MKNILITGGAGFIGSNLSLKLMEKGYNVCVLDNLSEQIHGKNSEESILYLSIKDYVKFIKGDVRNIDDLRLALEGMDAVIHLAAETGTGQSMYDINHYTDVNIGGTSLLLDLIANSENEVKKIVVASSRAIYGEGKYECEEHGIQYPGERSVSNMERGDFNIHCPICNRNCKPLPTDEHSPCKPSSIYGITKQNQEQMVLTVGKSIGVSAVALRYQNVYGPGQSLSNPYTGILSIFSTRVRNGNEINIFEDGNESRDFVYIDDVVDATILAVESDDSVFDSYNVGSGASTSVKTVAESICKNLELTVPCHVSGNFRLGDICHNFADLTKIERDLGFKPKIDFETGIASFIKWVKSESIKEDNYDKSIKELKDKGLYK